MWLQWFPFHKEGDQGKEVIQPASSNRDLIIPGNKEREGGRQTNGEHLQAVPGLQDEGEKGDEFPSDPRAPKMLSARPCEKSFPDPCAFQPQPTSFTASRSQDAVYGRPILQPLFPGPKGIWPGQEAGGWRGGCSPPSPSLNPAGRRKEEAGLGDCRLLTEPEGQDPPGRAT